jgi:molybdopterin molybdotransferase
MVEIPRSLHPDLALQLVRDQVRPLPLEEIPITEAFARIAGEDIAARVDLPAFPKSAMDGFALAFSANQSSYRVVDSIFAGTPPKMRLSPGECARIMTGAMVPEGADRVIPFELCTESKGLVSVTKPGPARNVCAAGENFSRGNLVLRRGEMIEAAEMAVVAAAGFNRIKVHRRPRVAVISTGTELVSAGKDLPCAHAYDSNGPQLLGQLARLHLTGTFAGICPDNLHDLTAHIEKARHHHDVVLLSGGISQGDYDLVPEAFQQCGIRLVFQKLALKPGRPTIFGMRDQCGVFGLPGNPLAVFLIFEFLVKPYLHGIMGLSTALPMLTGALESGFSRKKTDRVEMLPVIFDGHLVKCIPCHGPAHVNALRHSNAFIRIEQGITEIPPGASVPVLLIR